MLGNIGCSPCPSPLLYSSRNASHTSAASVVLGIPILTELNGTWEPALECIVFKLYTIPCIAWCTLWFNLFSIRVSSCSPFKPRASKFFLISCLVGSTNIPRSLSKLQCDWPPNISFWVDWSKIQDNSAADSILLGGFIVP